MDPKELNKIRKQQKISIAELAQRANLPKRTVENILFGIVSDPRVSSLEAIEEALGLRLPNPTQNERASGVVDTLRVSITAEEDNLLVLYREIGRKKGADRQRLFMQIGRLILESE